MQRKLITACFIVLVTSLMCTVAVPVPQVSAELTPHVYVDPPAVINQALVPGTTFNVSVKVDDIPADPGVAGIEFKLTWDATLLNCTNLQEIVFHEVTPEASWGNIWSLKLSYNNTGGYLNYGQTWQDINLAISEGYAPMSGNHTIANITFKVKAIGKTALHFAAVKLGDQVANPIPNTVTDGFFSNAPPPLPALLYVDPPTISNVSLIPGNDFTVNVSIINATDVKGLQFSLGFNASMVTANSVTQGSLIPLLVTPIIQIDNLAGFITFNATLLAPLNGNGDLAAISFHIEDLGGTSLHLYGVHLVDSFKMSLPYATSDGSFDNVLLAKIAVQPPEIIDPGLVPPATFTINVTIAEVRDLYGYQFNLTFDPNVVICLQAQIHDVLGEMHYVPNQNIDNLQGFAFINVSYYPPAVPLDIDSPVPFVTLKFRVKAIGSTSLNLTDTGLVDSTGQPITHEVFNGFFQSLIVDIAVIDLYASPSQFYKGGSTNVNVTVLNEGNTTQSFAVNIYYNSTLLTTVNVINLASNANATFTVPWSTATVQWGKYLLSAYVPPLLYETHISDNNLTDGIVKVKIPGDINGDDAVDIFDALLASSAYGSSSGDPIPPWNPDADLNFDGTIDIFDVIILSAYFGTKI